MGKEIILQDGKITMGFRGGIAVTVDAIKTLQRIGIAYGMYSDYEESPDVRVELVKEPIRELVVMTKTSNRGSPIWEKSHTLTRDPKAIDRYLAFRLLYRDLLALEQEEERKRNASQAGSGAAFTLNDVFGEQHEPTLDDVFSKQRNSTMEDVYQEQHEQPEPTFYEEYHSQPEPTLEDLFGEGHEPTLDDVFGKPNA